jgi:CRISPR/Cas system CSM-associated protein Csm2 small subunit
LFRFLLASRRHKVREIHESRRAERTSRQLNGVACDAPKLRTQYSYANKRQLGESAFSGIDTLGR